MLNFEEIDLQEIPDDFLENDAGAGSGAYKTGSS